MTAVFKYFMGFSAIFYIEMTQHWQIVILHKSLITPNSLVKLYPCDGSGFLFWFIVWVCSV